MTRKHFLILLLILTALVLSSCGPPKQPEPSLWECMAKTPKPHVVRFLQPYDPADRGGIADNGWNYDWFDIRHCRRKPVPSHLLENERNTDHEDQ